MSVLVKNETYNGSFENEFQIYNFPLSDFQKWAIDGYLNSLDVFVQAATGSGKTLPAEFAIQHSTRKFNKKVIYTSPIKSLSNQKFDEFKRKFPDLSIGILTGDIKYNPTGNVLIMTTEILRNLLYHKKITDIKTGIEISVDIYNDVDTVIFDEVHYINDADRGAAWEESIILLPKHIKLIMLSATLDNSEHFCSWIAGIKDKDCILTGTSTRIVPLRHSVFVSYLPSYIKKNNNRFGKIFQTLDRQPVIFSDEHDKFKSDLYSGINRDLQLTAEGFSKNAFNDLTDYLSLNRLLPCLFFCFSRLKCEQLAKTIEWNFLTGLEASDVDKTIDYYLRKTDNYENYIKLQQYDLLKSCLIKGIAYHHSGLLPIFKEIIEILYSKNLVKVLFATETFAVGVNMPTKTVIFTSLEKFTNTEMRTLYTHEYLQMAGRAGRRGIDKEGLVIIMANSGMNSSIPDTPIMKNLICGRSQSIQSKFVPNYQFLLKIILQDVPIERIIDSSLVKKESTEQIEETKKKINQLKQLIPTIDFNAAIRYHKLIQGQTDTGIQLSQQTIKKNKKLADEIAKTDGFTSIYNEYLNCKKNIDDLAYYENELNNSNDFIKEQTNSALRLLYENGFINKKDFPLTKENVLEKGIIASEICECNEILLTEFILSGYLDDLDYKYLGALLGMFCDSKPMHKNDSIESQTIYDLEDAFNWFNQKSIDYENKEHEYHLLLNSKWELNTCIMDAAYDWLDGQTFTDVIKNYDLFDGSFIKDLLKIYNLSAELESGAKLANKNVLANEASKIRLHILREIVNMESLYIK